MNQSDFEGIQEAREEMEAQRQEAGQKPPQVERVEFNAAQQEKVNQLIREAQGRAAKELRDKLAAKEAELVALKGSAAKTTGPATNDLAARVVELEAQNAAMRKEAAELTVMSQLRAVSGGFVDVDLAARLLRDSCRVSDDGKITVVDADGNERRNASFDPLSIQELASELASSRPFLAKGTVRSGAGSSESRGYMPTQPLEDLFGKGAKPGAAGVLNRIAKSNPTKYRAMKESARERGLIR